ncbi:hypothetical protein [[Clostridium] polysaccharolyticum]|uniref:Uncharacterized protein n=1 Tax=[Clostridium] polysaccharolyticum TaxID=29364 RepID=A0A1I0D3R1_9FIRM|nr:hypothetical protein [[Clostridium] polysaccharolyticum]SET26570.1 hypothetical protein SAMN04487772_11299 [[Clostridium] polysaccharolyticum]
MTKKIKLVFVFVLYAFILTACGAKVHTETSFHRDGSGTRIIYVEIAAKDEGQIKGGFDRLEDTLKEKSPECIEVKRYEDVKRQVMVYECRYDFTDIEDLKKKTKEVTAKEPSIKWEVNQGAFQGAVSYEENTTTKDLIKWAKDLLEQENVRNAVLSEFFEEEESKVSFDGEIVWTGKENAFFQIDNTPEVKEISVYTILDDEGKEEKRIKLGFSYEDFKSMNVEEGLHYLHEFSKAFRVDETCNGYSVTLTNQKELEAFFEKASGELGNELPYKDLNIKKPDKNYYLEKKCDNNLFSNQFLIKEVYNLNQLLSGFRVTASTVKDYVSVPRRNIYKSEQVHHTYGLESNKAYPYIGEYNRNDTYYLDFCGGESAKLLDTKVSYSIDENLVGLQSVVLEVEKNGMELANSQVMKFYSNLGEKVQYEEDGEKVRITFSKELLLGKEDKKSVLKKIHTFGIHKLKYEFSSVFSLSRYIPLKGNKVSYTISIPLSLKVQSFSFGNKTFHKKEIKKYKDNQNWSFQADLDSMQEGNIKLDFSKPNMLFYGIMSIAVLLLIGGGLSAYFYYKSKPGK